MALAWSEGFATFFSLMAQRVMSTAAMNIPDAGDDFYDDYNGGLHVSLDVSDFDLNDQLPGVGEDDELSVARALWQIWQDPTLGLSDQGILTTLQHAAPTNLSAAVPALMSASNATPFDASKPASPAAEQETDDFGCILTGSAVAPYITDPPATSTANPNYPPTVTWRRGGASPAYPLTQFQVQYWSADWSQLLFTSPTTTATF